MGHEDSTLAAICGLLIATPYGGLGTDEARSALDRLPDFDHTAAGLPRIIDAVRDGQRWNALELIESLAATWPATRRNLVGLELVLGDPPLPADLEVDQTVYLRRVDVCLEALQTEYSADEALAATVDIPQTLAEESKSTTLFILGSEGLAQAFDLILESQAWVSGGYVPYAGDAVRWGQRKLDTVNDDEILWALATDLARLNMRMAAGDVDNVRAYGRLPDRGHPRHEHEPRTRWQP